MHEDVKPYLTKENLQINDVWVAKKILAYRDIFFLLDKNSSNLFFFSSEVIISKLILIFFLNVIYTFWARLKPA